MDEELGPEGVRFVLEQDGVGMELTYDSWRDFVSTMRNMAPLWNAVHSLEELATRMQNAAGQ